MIAVASIRPRPRNDRRQRNVGWWMVYLLLLVIGGVIAIVGSRTAPQLSALAFLLLFLSIVATALWPIVGLFTIVFFSLVSDAVTIPWYPFVSTFSSRESILFVARGLTVTPLDVILAVTMISWLVRLLGTRQGRPLTGSLAKPMAVFTAFVLFGFVNGIRSGGSVRIAVLEGRSLFYLGAVYLLVINLCGKREMRSLMWTAMAGITANAVIALWYLSTLNPAERGKREDLGQHVAAVHYTTLLILFISLLAYRRSSRYARRLLFILSVPVLAALVVSQRRASMIALIFAGSWVLLTLWWRHRARFFVVAPFVLLGLASYTAAFWNSASSIGVGAQAIKSVIAPNYVSSRDSSSNLYRNLENLDLNYTIRQSPVLGLGFGNRFLRPIPLPRITFFELAEYTPHNSLLWVWIKMGFLGFASLFWLLGTSVVQGVGQLFRERDPTQAAVVMAALGYVASYSIFSYVDISWDSTGVVFFGVAMAICSTTLGRPAVARLSRHQLVQPERPEGKDVFAMAGGHREDGHEPAPRVAHPTALPAPALDRLQASQFPVPLPVVEPERSTPSSFAPPPLESEAQLPSDPRDAEPSSGAGLNWWLD